MPADGFVEWQGERYSKEPWAIVPVDGEPIAFAGLWEGWTGPASREVARTFTIVTTDPNEAVAPIHNRMPVVLPEEVHAAWLDEQPATREELQAMLRPAPAALLRAFPIARKVTRDEPALLEPAA